MLIFVYSVLALKLHFWKDDFSSISLLLVVSHHHIQLEFDVEKKISALLQEEFFQAGCAGIHCPSLVLFLTCFLDFSDLLEVVGWSQPTAGRHCLPLLGRDVLGDDEP